MPNFHSGKSSRKGEILKLKYQNILCWEIGCFAIFFCLYSKFKYWNHLQRKIGISTRHRPRAKFWDLIFGIRIMLEAFPLEWWSIHLFYIKKRNKKVESSKNIVNIKGRSQKNTVWFGKSFPNMGGWGGWFPNKVQTSQNPPKSPRESPFSTQVSPFAFPNLTKTLGWMVG